MNIKKKLILLSSCLMLTGFALVRNVTKEDVQEVRAEEEKYFKQITSKEELICGEGEKYLIASIGDSLIFDGSLQTLDVEGNKFDVTINDSKQIDYSEELNKSTFTIEDAGSSKYYIKSSSGKYIGNTTTKNNLEESDNQKYSNTITINSDGSVDIISNNTYLRYNNDKKNGTRFRYYKSTSYMNQQPISLFKLNSASSEYTVKFNANGGYFEEDQSETKTLTTKDQKLVEELPEPKKDDENGLRYEFAGWYLASDGNDTFTKETPITSNLEVFAHWTSSKIPVNEDFQNSETQASLAFSFTEGKEEKTKFVSYCAEFNSKITETYKEGLTDSDLQQKDNQKAILVNTNISYYGNGGALKLNNNISKNPILTYKLEEQDHIIDNEFKIQITLSSDKNSSQQSGSSTLKLISYDNENKEIENCTKELEASETFDLILSQINEKVTKIELHYIAGNYNFGLKKIEILTHKEEIASSTFKNFKDISIRFKNSFTITEDNKSEIAETGILLSKINDETNENIVKIKNLKQSYSETDFNSIVTGLNAHKSVNTSLKDNYLIALNVPNDKLIDKVFAVSYMKDNNNQYYFNNYKLMSVKDILDGYLDMEGEQIQFDDGSSVSLSDLALSCEIDLGL